MSSVSDSQLPLRILLRKHVRLRDLEDFALGAGWTPLGARLATDSSPFSYTWDVEDAGVEAQYVWDDLVEVGYLRLVGAAAQDVAVQVRASVDTEDVDEVLDRLEAAEGRDQRLDALLRLGVARPEPTPRALGAARAAATDADPWVRRALITASGYLGWPSILQTVRELQDRDPDPQVREEAGIVLGAMLSGDPRNEEL